jgi:predicted nuclease of predicted toxin-antitoxin system
MRFLVDEDLAIDVAIIGRRFGLDVVAVQEVDRRGWTDEQQLAQAAIDGRCIVTANRDDFANLSTQFMEEGRPHAGVLVVPESLRRQGAARMARALVAFNRARGDFPSQFLWDYLPHPDRE